MFDTEQQAANEQPTEQDTNVEMVTVQAQPVYLMDGCVKVMINGSEKFIAMDSFLEILDRSISADRAARVEDMFLPSNVMYMGRSASKLFLNCYYAGGVRNVTYGSSRPSVIPNIVVAHSLESRGADWQVSSTKYFCTDIAASRLPRRFINAAAPSDRVFLLPFTNTYGDGRMCYGSNTMPVKFQGGNLRGLDWYYQYLFESPFNDDLGLRALARQQSPSDWYRSLAKKAKDGEPFPYELLEGFTPLS